MPDRWIIIGFLSLAQNGIYAIAIKIAVIILIVNAAFSLAWKDNVIVTHNHQNKNEHYTSVFQAFSRLLATSVIFLTLIAIGTLIAFFITWLLRVQFAKNHFHVRFNRLDMVMLSSLMFLAIPIPSYVGKVGLILSVLAIFILFAAYNWRLSRSLVKTS